MAFEVIETQEQFDEAIKERIARVEKKYEGFISPDQLKERMDGLVSADELKKFEGFMSPEDVKKKYEGYLSPEEAKEKDETIKRYEKDSAKTKIANEFGLPSEIISRIQGDTEEEMREDAEVLSKLFKKQKKAPNVSHEDPSGDARKESLSNMLKGIKGE